MSWTDSTLDLAALAATVTSGDVIVDPGELDAYRYDRSSDPDVGVPAVVVRARTTEDVQAAVRFAGAHGLAVVPRGAGSGLSGGSSAIDGCMIVSTELMREIRVDPRTRTLVTQPGALNAEVKAAAAAHGLWYPPDPASFEICSIGGNIATNAGGLCCVKYGVTTDYVLGLTVVLADGRAVTLGGPLVKDVAGLALTKLFVGSEGTLGIVTSITLRVLPAQRVRSTLVATFAALEDATAAVVQITQRMRPSMLEFMDRPTIHAVDDMTGLDLDRDAAAMLVIQSDEPAEFAKAEVDAIEAVCQANGATATFCTADADEGETYVAARRNAIPAVERTGTVLLGDVGVPIPRLGELVSGIRGIAERHGVTIAVIAHAGDGNTHPMAVYDPADSDEQARAMAAYGEVMDLAIGLGGTITGEHGVGRMKRPWLENQVGADVVELNRRIKAALDPDGILNPGVGY